MMNWRIPYAGFHHSMKQAGIEVLTTKVGDRYVLEEMLRADAALGGEQSGHIIWEELGPTGDGIAAALLTMRALGDRELGSAIPMRKIPQMLRNVEIADPCNEVVDAERTSLLDRLFPAKPLTRSRRERRPGTDTGARSTDSAPPRKPLSGITMPRFAVLPGARLLS